MRKSGSMLAIVLGGIVGFGAMAAITRNFKKEEKEDNLPAEFYLEHVKVGDNLKDYSVTITDVDVLDSYAEESSLEDTSNVVIAGSTRGEYGFLCLVVSVHFATLYYYANEDAYLNDQDIKQTEFWTEETEGNVTINDEFNSFVFPDFTVEEIIVNEDGFPEELLKFYLS